MKILFITAHRLGDAVLSMAVLSALVERYPQARFTIACGPTVTGLFQNVPRCEAVIALSKRSYNRHWLSLWRQCATQRWFMVVDLRSSLVGFGLWARHRVLVKGGRRPGHKITQHAHALGWADIPKPRLWLSQERVAKRRSIFPKQHQWVALAPTAGSPVKAWSAASFVALARALETLGLHPVIFYGPGEVEYEQARSVVEALPYAYDLGGRYPLEDVACLLRQCRLFVGNDSGLMHLAAAASVPTLGLFGPSCVSQYAPVGPYTMTVCAPGIEGEGKMEQLKVDDVKEAAFRLFQLTEDGASQRERNDAL